MVCDFEIIRSYIRFYELVDGRKDVLVSFNIGQCVWSVFFYPNIENNTC